MRRTYSEIRCSVGKPSYYTARPVAEVLSCRLPPYHGVFIGPGPLNGKTALVQTGANPRFVTAQFDDRTLLVPHIELKLDTPWWGNVAFGWTLFQAKFFRKI